MWIIGSFVFINLRSLSKDFSDEDFITICVILASPIILPFIAWFYFVRYTSNKFKQHFIKDKQ